MAAVDGLYRIRVPRVLLQAERQAERQAEGYLTTFVRAVCVFSLVNADISLVLLAPPGFLRMLSLFVTNVLDDKLLSSVFYGRVPLERRHHAALGRLWVPHRRFHSDRTWNLQGHGG